MGRGGGGGGMNSLETSLISPSKFQTGLEGGIVLIPYSGVGGGGGIASDPLAIVCCREIYDDRKGTNTGYSKNRSLETLLSD